MKKRCCKLSAWSAVFFFTMTSAAHAEDLCLAGFNGRVTWAFNLMQLFPFSGSSGGPVTGRSFGTNLAPCRTNGNFPLDGTMTLDGPNQLVIGFIVHAVNPPTSCGSIELKIVLNLTTLSGPLGLHNARNNFDNTTTVSLISCPATIDVTRDPVLAGTIDPFGNTVD